MYPDKNFSMLDCRLLFLLNMKHDYAKWLSLSTEFCRATGRMVDGRILKEELSSQGGFEETGFDDSFSTRDYSMLRYVYEKLEADKWLAVKADFDESAGRTISVEMVRQKLGDM